MKEVRARVERALAAVDIVTRLLANRSPFELSGGEKRRAAIAGVLAMERFGTGPGRTYCWSRPPGAGRICCAKSSACRKSVT